MEHALQSPSLSSLRATVQGAEPWNKIDNVLSFGSTLLILGVSKYEQSLFHISCSSNHCTCKRMQKKRKESILMLRLMGAAPKECKRNYFDYEVLHSEKRSPLQFVAIRREKTIKGVAYYYEGGWPKTWQLLSSCRKDPNLYASVVWFRRKRNRWIGPPMRNTGDAC